MTKSAEELNRRSVLRDALLRIEELEARLTRVQNARREPIAIIGMACRFPGGADDPESFWGLIERGVDAISEVPPDRWDLKAFYDPDPTAPGKMYTRFGGFLRDVGTFDAEFFGVAPREALKMDPQHRLLLEVAWESLEDAGIPAGQIEGSRTGVFVGITGNEYLQRINRHTEGIDAYHMTGGCLNFATGRLSYLLGLQGPSLAVDTACSSSLVALHLACQSLRSGECRLAMAGGVNLILSPEATIMASKARMLAPDGRCKTFDARADGFARGEGCGVVVLKRLGDARADGDRVLALIRGTAVNQDGKSSGLTVPNKLAQQAVIREALACAGVEPAQVDYVEAHGTGTSLGDPIEVRALAAVLGQGRSNDSPFLLGSVKTNIGHLESAAGVAGLIKVILSLQHQAVPPHLHLHAPNPHIAWDEVPARIPTALTPWPITDHSRIAGLSSFGGSGTNAHVVLEEAPAPIPDPPAVRERPRQILILSAKTQTALCSLAKRYGQHLGAHPEVVFSDACYTANAGRIHFPHRLALVAETMAAAQAALAAVAAGERAPGVLTGPAVGPTRPKVAFLFTGQGAQYVGMGRELYETQPTFRQALDRCAELLRPHLEHPLLAVMFGAQGTETFLDETGYTQPALFALEYALAELWRSWRVEPAWVLGHSVGEVVAACVAGVVSLEDGLALIAARARLMQALPKDGTMVAVWASADQVRALLGAHARDVALAALNGPASVVLSGHREAVGRVVRELDGAGIKTKALAVSHAFHSPLMEPILAEFERTAAGLRYVSPRLGLISNITGRPAKAGEIDAAYWRRHVRAPVQFQAGIEALRAQGVTVFLEVGPHPILLGLGQACVPGGYGVWLSTLRKGRPDWESVLASLGELYVRGVPVDWVGFDRDYPRRKISLPTYPYQRERFWVEHESLVPGTEGRTEYGERRSSPLVGAGLSTPLGMIVFEPISSSEMPAYLQEHQVRGRAVMPAAAYLEMAFEAASSTHMVSPCIADLLIGEPLVLEADASRTIQSVVTNGKVDGLRFKVFSRADEQEWRLHAESRIIEADGTSTKMRLEEIQSRCVEPIAIETHYASLGNRGLEFGPTFRGVEALFRGKHEALGRIRLPEGVDTTGYRFCHPALLDSCLQVIAVALSDAAPTDTFLPMQVGRLETYGVASGTLWSHALVRGDETADSAIADLQFFDDDGGLVAEVLDLKLQRITSKALTVIDSRRIAESCYELAWKLALASDKVELQAHPGTWLILSDHLGIGAAIAERLRQRGERCLVARADSVVGPHAEDELALDPVSLDDMRRALLFCGRDTTRPLRGVIHLWGIHAELTEETSVQQFASIHRLGCRSLLSLCQVLSGTTSEERLRLFVATRGAHAVNSEPVEPVQTAMLGLARTYGLEEPRLQLTCVDLDPLSEEGHTEALWTELWTQDGEGQVAYRRGVRYVPRLVRQAVARGRRSGRMTAEADRPLQLKISARGMIGALQAVPVERRPPGTREVEIRVRATGLNFRDVLNVLGMYPGEVGAPGSECAGSVVRVGSDVDGIGVGDAVVALAESSFSTYVTVPVDRVVLKPPTLGFEQAAAIPIAFMTAVYALRTLAGISANDRILIHAAAGGVGLAAVQLAQQAGAEIFATAGSDEKRAFLKGLGIPHIMDSRSTDFAAEIMRVTNGRGVTIVLNSLSGDFIRRSLAVLAPGGRFLELGKIGIWDADRVAQATTRAAYHVIYLGEVLDRQPGLARDMLSNILMDIASGRLAPLPLRQFAFEDAQDAFRYMAQAKHIGKIVVTQTEVPETLPAVDHGRLAPESSYLITGGLGALGRLAAEWLVGRGARQVVLMGRSAPGAEAQKAIERMEGAGARVSVARGDVSCEADVIRVLSEIRRTMGPLRGIVHTAGVVNDAILSQQDWKRFEVAMEPKASGAWLLHRFTRGEQLDFFVVFSSTAALLGSPGQANYAAANAFLDGLIGYRRARGLVGTSINWGAWSGAGMAAALGTQHWERWRERGMQGITPSEGTLALEHILETGVTQAAVLRLDWARFQRWCRANGIPRIWSELIQGTDEHVPTLAVSKESTTVERLMTVPPERRKALLTAHLREQVTAVLGLADHSRLDPDKGFRDLGLDSLMSVELRNRLEKSTGRLLPSTVAFDYPTLAALVDYVYAELFGQDRLAETTSDDREQGGTTHDLEALSEEEAEALLERELRQRRVKRP